MSRGARQRAARRRRQREWRQKSPGERKAALAFAVVDAVRRDLEAMGCEVQVWTPGTFEVTTAPEGAQVVKLYTLCEACGESFRASADAYLCDPCKVAEGLVPDSELCPSCGIDCVPWRISRVQCGEVQ